MRIKSLLFCTLAASAFSAHARFTAEQALLSMPPELIAPVMPQTVADLVEYARAGRFDHSELNRFGGQAQITAMDSACVQMTTGTGRSLALSLLPLKRDTVIMVIETLAIPQADSRLTLYSRDWTPLPELWREPKAADWLTDEGRKNRRAFEDAVPFISSEYLFYPVSGILTLTNSSEKQTGMRSVLRYSWTPRGFKKLKD